MRSDTLTESIIGCAYTVANALGNGFLEKVYENAIAHELKKNGLRVEQQCSIPVHYDDIIVGEYLADLLVEGNVLVELKAVKAIEDIHKAQCLHYLKATGKQICLLLNFGAPKMQIKRIVNNFRLHCTEGAED
ncbi:MAG: GxxExxY protein [Syntrophorhabdales bacterium]|jgi:GxxExxY protein